MGNKGEWWIVLKSNTNGTCVTTYNTKQKNFDIQDDIIKQANEFRLNNYKRELSYIDCLGYILAKKRGFKFLTGDEQFKYFDNVEFVK